MLYTSHAIFTVLSVVYGVSMLDIYIADMSLHGILIFSTEQRPSLAGEGGAVISTCYYIHNYPLIYGFMGVSAEAYAVIPSLHFRFYEQIKNEVPEIASEPLHYGLVERLIKNLLEGREGIYVYPAQPLRITTKKFFMRAKGSGYADFQGALKNVYPRIVHYVAITPPSEFRTIVLALKKKLPKELYIRIGMKRMGLFKIRLREAKVEDMIDASAWSSIPVNLYDINQFGYSSADDFIKVLETRSKPLNKPTASVIGYIKTRDLFIIRDGFSELRIPLPQKLLRK